MHMRTFKNLFIRLLLLSSIIVSYSANAGLDVTKATPKTSSGLSGESDNLTLEFLHVNDVHSYLSPIPQTFITKDGRIKVNIGGVSALSSIIKEKRAKNPNLLVISAGDQITGNAANYDNFKGKADAEVYAIFGTDYYTLGNHEFDYGIAGMTSFAKFLDEKPPTPTLVISNLELDGYSSIDKYIHKSHVADIAGHEVAVMAITDAKKIYKSSRPDRNMRILEGGSVVNNLSKELPQKYKVLITHEGVNLDIKNAALFDDIDVIIGGDSHSLCANFKINGLEPECPYPIVMKNKSGKNVCIVQAYEYGKVIGDLKVIFNKDGDVIRCEGQPYMPVWVDSAKYISKYHGKAPRKTAQDVVLKLIEEHKELVKAKPDPQMDKVLEPYITKINEIYNEVVGYAKEDLCSVRRISDSCRIKENFENKGSETCQVIGQVMLNAVDADIFIANSGAFRTHLNKGDITLYALSNLMPFKNEIKLIDIRGDELIRLLNQVVDYVRGDLDSRDGGVPCGTNLVVKLKKSGKSPVKEVYIKTAEGYDLIIPHKIYRMATFEYLTSGKDGYKQLSREQPIPTGKKDIDLVLDYLKENGSLPLLDKKHMLLQSE